MNSVGAVGHLLVIVRTTAGRGFLFVLSRITYGVLLLAYLRLIGPPIWADVLDRRLVAWFRSVFEGGVVVPKSLGGFNGPKGGPTIYSVVTVSLGS